MNQCIFSPNTDHDIIIRTCWTYLSLIDIIPSTVIHSEKEKISLERHYLAQPSKDVERKNMELYTAQNTPCDYSTLQITCPFILKKHNLKLDDVTFTEEPNAKMLCNSSTSTE